MAFMPGFAALPFGGGLTLRGLNEEQMRALSIQTGIQYEFLKAQQRAEMASAGSSGDIPGEQLVPTVEVRLKSNAKNPGKARRKNIKMLRKALRPPNYNLGLFKVYRYNAAHECACCGVDVRRFLEGDNAYAHIMDEKVGLSLADLYWFDEDTGNAKKPHARTHGDHGDEMNSTLCPAHLHIYHTLRSLVEEQQMAEDGFAKIASKGTRFMRVPGMGALTSGMTAQKNRSTPDSILKYEPFFKQVHIDAEHSKGVQINQYENPVTGLVDLVQVTFDLRILQTEAQFVQSNPLAATSMNAGPQQGMTPEA